MWPIRLWTLYLSTSSQVTCQLLLGYLVCAKKAHAVFTKIQAFSVLLQKYHTILANMVSLVGPVYIVSTMQKWRTLIFLLILVITKHLLDYWQVEHAQKAGLFFDNQVVWWDSIVLHWLGVKHRMLAKIPWSIAFVENVMDTGTKQGVSWVMGIRW